ncbi:MAG: arylsulfatase [Planctomycetota bacterium]
MDGAPIAAPRRVARRTLALGLLLLASCGAPGEAPRPDGTPRRPNVLLIYGDDVGWGDVGAYGSALIPTPNIDRLAARGVRFTDAHCSASTCTPSRFSLLTGVHGFRSGVRVLPPDAPLVVPTDATTLADVFRDAGYTTSIVGKWHLGLGAAGERVDWNGEVAPGPLELGFDRCFLLPSTNDRVPCVFVDGHDVVGLDASDPLFVGARPQDLACTEYPNGKLHPEAMTYYRSTVGHADSVINGIGRIGTMWGGSDALWDDEEMADVFVERAASWIRGRDRERPFFLWYSAQDIHVPRTPNARFRGATTLGYRGDAMVALDWVVGELVRTLEEEGIAEDTLVIFTSDNGPVYDDGYDDGTTVPTSTREVDRGHDASGPWRGGKYQIYEGGTRVPFVVSWPGRVEPGVSGALVSQIDLVASFASLLGRELRPDEAIDSRDALAALLGDDPRGATFLVEESGRLALREGTWKFVAPRGEGSGELYDLATDPGEGTDLAALEPDRAAGMAARLERLASDGSGLRASAPRLGAER